MSKSKNLSWFGNQKEKYLAILQAEDQDRIRGDLRTFFGPRAERFLPIYEKFRSNPKGQPFTWNWVVFFTTFPWFFYRKMYATGAAIVLVAVAASVLFSNSTGGSVGAVVFLALTANALYVQIGIRALQKADALELVGAQRAEYLRCAGGVSVTAGTLAGISFVALLGMAIVEIYAETAGP